MQSDEDDRALLAWLRQGVQEESPGRDEIDELLRGMGLNHNERRALRHHHSSKARSHDHGRRRRAGTDQVPYQDRIIKQFAWYIKELVPEPTGVNVSAMDAAATWAKLTNYKLDTARQWWDAGLHPLALDQIVDLLANDFEPQDLLRRVRGRTIAEHLGAGTSVTWCVMAARWTKPGRAGSPRSRQ